MKRNGMRFAHATLIPESWIDSLLIRPVQLEYYLHSSNASSLLHPLRIDNLRSTAFKPAGHCFLLATLTWIPHVSGHIKVCLEHIYSYDGTCSGQKIIIHIITAQSKAPNMPKTKFQYEKPPPGKPNMEEFVYKYFDCPNRCTSKRHLRVCIIQDRVLPPEILKPVDPLSELVYHPHSNTSTNR